MPGQSAAVLRQNCRIMIVLCREGTEWWSSLGDGQLFLMTHLTLPAVGIQSQLVIVFTL